MCHGPYIPGYLAIPFFLISSVGNGIHSIDQAIRANNLKIWQALSKQKSKFDHYASERVEQESSCSIDEIKKVFNRAQDEEKVSYHDREELAKMLMQRCLARLESSDFELAKQDLEEAFELINKKDDLAVAVDSSFIFYNYFGSYLMGVCYEGLGEFSQAAHHFIQSIQYQERVEQIAADFSEKKDNLEIQERMLELEKDFFSMQLETKNPLEKVASSWMKGFTQYNTTMTNLSNKAKNFYNHEMKMGQEKPILKQKPVTYFTPELFHIRAGLSYYSGTYYSNALPYLTKAIEIGESYESENVESSYYNRGLCYYYLGDLNKAIEDFTKSISLMPLLKQREQPYAMRAITYGRIGKVKEREIDLKRIKLINPFAKSLPLFHLRLLNDDVLCNILSFLQTKQVLVMSSLNRYTRGLAKNFLQHNDIEIGNYSMTVENLTRQNNRSIVEKMLLPKDPNMMTTDILTYVINHPLLIENAKNVMICKTYDYYSQLYQSMNKLIIEKYLNLKRLTIFSLSVDEISEFPQTLHAKSPKLSYFRIVSDNFELNYYYGLINSLTVDHLRLPKVFFDKNPFEFTNFKVVEYGPFNESDSKMVYHSYNDNYSFGNENITSVNYLSWEEIKQLNPSIIFIERKDTLHIDETSSSYFPVDCFGNKLW